MQGTASATVETVNDAPAVTNPVVTADFAVGGGSWERGGGLLFRYAAIEWDGEVYICGAYSRRGSRITSRLGREVMRQASLVSNGEVILRGMSHFRAVSSANLGAQLVGAETVCRSTGRATGSLDLNSLRVTTRAGNYRIDN